MSHYGVVRTSDADGGIGQLSSRSRSEGCGGLVKTRGLNSVRQNAMFARSFNEKTPVQSPCEKYSCFVLSEYVIDYRHPASSRGALRAIVTTREAGSDGREMPRACLHADERQLADVKSRGPGAPTLALSLWVIMISKATVANKPGTPRRARYKR